MARKWDIKLDKYGISKHRYRELYNFCLQYREFLSKCNQCYLLSAVSYDKEPQSNSKRSVKPVSDTTAKAAERAIELGKKIELIENTAKEACEELAPYVLRGVTQGIGYERLNPPCGEKQYHTARRKFYYLLDLRK